MAVAVDAIASSRVQDTNTTTFAHTVSGSERVLYVHVQTFDADGFTDGNVSSVTYNGVALTRIVHQQGIAGTNNWADIWRLIAPATGANNIVVTTTGTTNVISCASISFTGVDQTTPESATNSSTGTGQTFGPSITPTSDGNFITDNVQTEVADSIVNSTSNNTEIATSDNRYILFTRSTTAISPAAAYTFSYSNTGGVNEHWDWAAVAVQPTQAGGATATRPTTMALTGVGA